MLEAGQGEATEKREEARAPIQSGSMRLLFDETEEMESQRAARDAQLTDLRSRKRSTTLGFY